MSTKHTPGPWTRKMLDASHAMIHDADGMNVVPRMISEGGTGTEANSRLIAAAPDLLAALRDAAAALGTIARESTDATARNHAGIHAQLAHAAIAKAEAA